MSYPKISLIKDNQPLKDIYVETLSHLHGFDHNVGHIGGKCRHESPLPHWNLESYCTPFFEQMLGHSNYVHVGKPTYVIAQYNDH